MSPMSDKNKIEVIEEVKGYIKSIKIKLDRSKLFYTIASSIGLDY